jgi:hypothetical protein
MSGKKQDLMKYGEQDDFWSRLIANANRKVARKSKFVLFLESRRMRGLRVDDLPADEQEFLGYLPSARAEAMLKLQREQAQQAIFDADEAEDADVVEDGDAGSARDFGARVGSAGSATSAFTAGESGAVRATSAGVGFGSTGGGSVVEIGRAHV